MYCLQHLVHSNEYIRSAVEQPRCSLICYVRCVAELVMVFESDSKKQSCLMHFLFRFGSCVLNGVVSNSMVVLCKVGVSSVGASFTLTRYDLRFLFVLNTRSGGCCSFGFLVFRFTFGQYFLIIYIALIAVGLYLAINVTESVKTSLIAHDRKFDFITQTQSLMSGLSKITATDSHSKGICFF